MMEKAKPLDAQKAEFYASFVAKMFWVMKRERPYIEPTVSFLSTHVKGPDCNDWCKLKRLLCWTKQTFPNFTVVPRSIKKESLIGPGHPGNTTRIL